MSTEKNELPSIELDIFQKMLVKIMANNVGPVVMPKNIQLDGHNIKVRGFQKDVGEWSARNFCWKDDVEHKAVDPLFGVAEEVGELALVHAAGPNGEQIDDADWNLLYLIGRMGDLVHAHLKSKQGIRGSNEELQAKALVAMNEVRGALKAYTVAQDIDWEGQVPPAIRRLVSLKPMSFDRAHAEGGDAVADVLVYLGDYSERNELDMEGATNFTWARPVDPETGKGGVRYRDWTKNKVDGGGHGKVIIPEPNPADGGREPYEGPMVESEDEGFFQELVPAAPHVEKIVMIPFKNPYRRGTELWPYAEKDNA